MVAAVGCRRCRSGHCRLARTRTAATATRDVLPGRAAGVGRRQCAHAGRPGALLGGLAVPRDERPPGCRRGGAGCRALRAACAARTVLLRGALRLRGGARPGGCGAQRRWFHVAGAGLGGLRGGSCSGRRRWQPGRGRMAGATRRLSRRLAQGGRSRKAPIPYLGVWIRRERAIRAVDRMFLRCFRGRTGRSAPEEVPEMTMKKSHDMAHFHGIHGA